MSLRIQPTESPELASPQLIELLAEACADGRPAVVLVPSLTQALDLQRRLALYPKLALGVTCTTPEAWARERWEVWGDGRTPADPATRMLLAAKIVMLDTVGSADGLAHTPGMARTLAKLVRDALPQLADGSSARARDLDKAQKSVLALVRRYREGLHAGAFVEPCEIMDLLPRTFAREGVALPSVFAVGFAGIPSAASGFLADLSALCPVVLLVHDDATPATELARISAQALADAVHARGVIAEAGACTAGMRDKAVPAAPGPCPELSQVRRALFRAGEPGVVPPWATGAVREAVATGPLAEAELVAREVGALVKGGARSIVVCSNDSGAAWDALAPRLAVRGVRAEGSQRTRMAQVPAIRAFLGLAQGVCGLVEACAAWGEGGVDDVQPMQWWPPRTLTDFMLSPISGVSQQAAWEFDKRVRGNRALTPHKVLAMLQRKGATSQACAQAVSLLAEGRIGAAAHLLAGAYIEGGGSGDAQEVAALELIAQIQSSAAHLGISQQGGSSLRDLIGLLELVLRVMDIASPCALGPGDAPATVRICTRVEAARLAPQSVDAMVFMRLTSAEWPLKQADDAAARLLVELGITPPADPLVLARSRFAAAFSAARSAVVLERSLRDADGKATYPAVVLSELLATYGEDAGPGRTMGDEGNPAGKLSASGCAPGPGTPGVASLAFEDGVQDRSLLILSRDGAHGQDGPGGLVLSATQIEMYLACPFRWFTQNRIKVDGIDADFTNLQKGSFAHVVLERTHRELLRRAAVAHGMLGEQDPPDALDGLPVPFIPGARVSPGNLHEAASLLDAVFDEHLSSQRERALRKESLSLVPHSASERHQIDMLRRNLHSALAFESTRFAGFEPRFFELRFGSGEGMRHVAYAGAQIVGTIDRIDVDEQGRALIIDYKHKGAAGFAKEYNVFAEAASDSHPFSDDLYLPRHIQALAYAQIVRRLYPQLKVVGAVFFSTMGTGGANHVIAGCLNGNVAPRVMGEEGGAWEGALCPPPGTTFEELLDSTEQRVATLVSRLAGGDIEPSPRDAEACRHCPVIRCERRLV